MLTALHEALGHRIYARDSKLARIAALGLPSLDPAQLFTSDPASTPLHVVDWGFLGETWPYFRPNFVNMETYRCARGGRFLE